LLASCAQSRYEVVLDRAGTSLTHVVAIPSVSNESDRAEAKFWPRGATTMAVVVFGKHNEIHL
jgi:hypothetical protein